MCIWAGGHRLGDIDEPACMLNVTEVRFQSLMQRMNSLDDAVLRELSDRDAFEFLNRALYLDEERSDEQVTIDTERFWKFDFLTNGGESFDCTKSFIVGDADHLRILFESDRDGFASASVPRAAFTRVVQDFLTWMAAQGERAG
jgi:hypothetical protein